MSTMPFLLRRELWEHRNLYIAPAVVAGLLLLAVLFAFGYAVPRHVGYEHLVAELTAASSGELQHELSAILAGPAVLFGLVMLIVLTVYLLDSLYADRKDRSILFWKSLPISDTATVLSKLVTAMVVVPVVTLALAFASALLNAIVLTIAIWLGGGSAWELLWQPAPLVSTAGRLGTVFVLHSLWYAPIFGWLLLASAWAKRSPMLWAVLPPLGLMALEGATLHTHRLGDLLSQRLVGLLSLEGSGNVGFTVEDGEVEFHTALVQMTDLTAVLLSPGLWVGLAVAAVFVAGAVWLRRYRDET